MMTRTSLVAVVLAPLSLVAVAPIAGAQYWGNYYHSSTAGESYARGLGDVVRAQGEANLNNSVAAGNYQDAYSKSLDNKLKQTETYWARRSIYDRKMAEESYERAQEREAYFAKTLLKPLGNEEFDATSGSISWPIVCREDKYVEYRSTVDKAFAKLASSGLLTLDEYNTASRTIRAWREAINADKDAYPTEALSQALRFLIKLNRELESQLG